MHVLSDVVLVVVFVIGIGLLLMLLLLLLLRLYVLCVCLFFNIEVYGVYYSAALFCSWLGLLRVLLSFWRNST